MANYRNQSAKETGAEKVAAEKAECDAVMQALGHGKKADEVAAGMNIPTSTVYTVFCCLRQANKAAVERQAREHAAKAGAASAEASASTSK
ncbi:MAG: hypothetical protein ACLQDV_25685 [Candidatus Binataceae bacterium]